MFIPYRKGMLAALSHHRVLLLAHLTLFLADELQMLVLEICGQILQYPLMLHQF
jgi:hypothetical protein